MPPDMLANRYSRRDLESVRRTVFDEMSNKPVSLREKMDLSKTKLRKFERKAAEDAYLLDKSSKSVRFDFDGRKKKKIVTESNFYPEEDRPFTPEFPKSFTIGKGYKPDADKIKKLKQKQGYPTDNLYRTLSRSSSIDIPSRSSSARTYVRTPDGGIIRTYPRASYTPPKKGVVPPIRRTQRYYTYPDRHSPPLDGYRPRGKRPTVPVGFGFNRAVEVPDYLIERRSRSKTRSRRRSRSRQRSRSRHRSVSASSINSRHAYPVHLPYIEYPPEYVRRPRSRSWSRSRPVSVISRASMASNRVVKHYHWSDRTNRLAEPKRYRRHYVYHQPGYDSRYPRINHEDPVDIRLKRWMRANEKRMREVERLDEERFLRMKQKEQPVKTIHVVHVPKKERRVPDPLQYKPKKPEEKSEVFQRRKQYDELLRRYHAENKTVYTTLKEHTKPQGILKTSTQKVTVVHEPKPPLSPKTSTTGTVKYTRKLKGPQKNEPCPFRGGQSEPDTVVVERKYERDPGTEGNGPAYLTRYKQRLDQLENDSREEIKIIEKDRKTVRINDIDKELLEADERSKKLQESGNGKRGSENPGRAYLFDSEPRQGTIDLEDEIGSEASGVRNPRDISETSTEIEETIDRSNIETGSVIERKERYNHSTWPSYSIDNADGDGKQCVVRAMSYKMPEIKRGIKSDGEDQLKNPEMTVPSSLEIDENNESFILKSSSLKWDHPFVKKPEFKDPIYLSIPIQLNDFNEILQQLVVVYCIDGEKWDYKEGDIKNYEDGTRVEIPFTDSFQNLRYGLKIRYKEDTKDFSPYADGHLQSTLDKGVRVQVPEGCYEKKAKLKIRVEPLDMNETDLSELMASNIALHALAVSPVVKISSSEPMFTPINLKVPSPGQSFFGSKKLGLKCPLGEVKNARVNLLTKTKRFTRYQVQDTLHSELAQQYDFPVQIPEKNGVCYCVLVLEGTEPISNHYVKKDSQRSEPFQFINGDFLKKLSLKVALDELKVKSLGRQLVNVTATDSVIRQHGSDIGVSAHKILKMWHNQNVKTNENVLMNQLIKSLKLSDMKEIAENVREEYNDYLWTKEEHKIDEIFREISECSAILINWKYIARVCALEEEEIDKIDKSTTNLKTKAYRMFKKSLSLMREAYDSIRSVLQAYISILRESGCPKIAGYVEKRYLDGFNVQVT
ncbi:DgyrCDS13058 [Dimorphilus gyrociliatus]|uniref:DgyrCDS13058 n=1 Tax=Dimorphilus gyrociliatus TaxID=2664684 RepID=A0A7I8W9K8_9ANNE|nr:DgyrCDS13058 [Dimorphilus gyrociliatus]